MFVSCALTIYAVNPLAQPLLGETGHNHQRAIEFFLIFSSLLAFTLASCRVYAINTLRSFASLDVFLFSVLVALFFVGAIFSDDYWRSLQESGRMFGLLVLALALSWSGEGRALRLGLAWLLIGIALIFLIRLVVVFIVLLSSPEMQVTHTLIDGFSNKRSFNHVQAFVVPFLYFRALSGRVRGRHLWLLSVLIASQWVWLFYSQGRGVFLAISVVLSIYVLRFSKSKLRDSCTVLAPFLAGFVIYYCMFVVWRNSAGFSEVITRGSSGRLELWLLSLKSILSNPLLGVGGQGFSNAIDRVSLGSAHNFILNCAVEYGVPVAMIFVFWIVRFFSLFWRAQGLLFFKAEGILMLATPLLYSFLTGMFLSPLSSVLFSFALACYFDSARKESAAIGVCGSNWRGGHRVVVALLFAMVASYIAVTLVDIVIFRASLSSCLYENGCFPRFWLNGDFRNFSMNGV